MRKILPILLALAMVLTLLPVSAFAVGTDRTEDLAALEEQMRQELFSADDRIYAEDYEAPEAPDPDEIIRVLVETRSAPALEIASTQGTARGTIQGSCLPTMASVSFSPLLMLMVSCVCPIEGVGLNAARSTRGMPLEMPPREPP